MFRNRYKPVVEHFDRLARQDRCPHCGMATGGYLYGASEDGQRGHVTGHEYKRGQQMHPLDNDICMCDQGLKFVG